MRESVPVPAAAPAAATTPAAQTPEASKPKAAATAAAVAAQPPAAAHQCSLCGLLRGTRLCGGSATMVAPLCRVVGLMPPWWVPTAVWAPRWRPPMPPMLPPPSPCLPCVPQSWRDPWAGTAAASRLAQLPSYANILCLSFMLPDATYQGGVTFEGTGLSFRCALGHSTMHGHAGAAAAAAAQPCVPSCLPCRSSDAAVVKGAIALLKQRHPATKVLISVGGEAWSLA